jgi:uridylate kinase
MDMTAITMAQENNKPILVFNMNVRGNLRRLLLGEPVATIVKE